MFFTGAPVAPVACWLIKRATWRELKGEKVVLVIAITGFHVIWTPQIYGQSGTTSWWWTSIPWVLLPHFNIESQSDMKWHDVILAWHGPILRFLDDQWFLGWNPLGTPFRHRRPPETVQDEYSSYSGLTTEAPVRYRCVHGKIGRDNARTYVSTYHLPVGLPAFEYLVRTPSAN